MAHDMLVCTSVSSHGLVCTSVGAFFPFALGATKAWSGAPVAGWPHTDIWTSSDGKLWLMYSAAKVDAISGVNARPLQGPNNVQQK